MASRVLTNIVMYLPCYLLFIMALVCGIAAVVGIMKDKKARCRGMKVEIHESHDMTPWKSTIVTLISTPRFGSIRSCRKCGAEHAKTVCGEDCHSQLITKCPE
jgi:hypothetical protein